MIGRIQGEENGGFWYDLFLFFTTTKDKTLGSHCLTFIVGFPGKQLDMPKLDIPEAVLPFGLF